jgi:hypothetical protein
MRKICLISLIYILSSCGSGDNNSTTGNDKKDNGTERRDSTDTKQPSGLDNSSVISTDTTAMKVQPKDSLKK